MPRYNPSVIEPKWQTYWESERTFATPRMPVGEKLYVLDMFPYPSGDGLHVGHPEGQTATDIVCRYARMRGKCVLHPMGWDAFGLPAEQYAKKTGTPPRVTTEKNIGTFRRQEKMLGFSYDWSRELATTDVEYFRWTQAIFLILFDTWFDTKTGKGRPIAELEIPPDVAAAGDEATRRFQDAHRLAYQSHAPVNWCPALGTVLANEEVIGGLSERGNHPVVRIPLRQWMLRITAYADRLENDLAGLDWPDSIKALQRNWIGRSSGAEVDFFIGASSAASGKPNPQEFKAWRNTRAAAGFPATPGDDVLRVFTTRPDTLYGATYMVVAPEHPLVGRLTTPAQAAAVSAYCEQASRKSDLDRTELAKEKTGVFTGSFAANPVNNRPVPIWVADYVLASYGTGAIMAVPAHDTRDAEFARQFGMEIVPVVDPGASVDAALRAEVLAGNTVFTEHGTAIHSGPYDGQSTAEMQNSVVADLAKRGQGRAAVNYKLRDWLFSRQHFWGEPFPILHELDDAGQPTGLVRTVPPEKLPVDLPELGNVPVRVAASAAREKPSVPDSIQRALPQAKASGVTADAGGPERNNSPDPPLEKAPADWLWVTVDGRRYKRETNTMPQWAGSCWYYLRFLDPKNQHALVDPELEQAWMPVDLYVGGAEHAVLHLLYARFWHKVLFDRGYVTTPEPFRRLINQGMILGEMEITGYKTAGENEAWVSAELVRIDSECKPVLAHDSRPLVEVKVPASSTERAATGLVLKADPTVRLLAVSHKMSKSRGNVVNPDEVVKQYGADSLRLFEMFMGPLEATKPWSMDGVTGVRKFLDRVWRMIVDERSETVVLNPAVQDVAPTVEQDHVLHRTIQAVTGDIDRMAFNTAIAKMMEFTNFFTKCDVRPLVAMERLVLLLSPFAPHLAEELWQLFGHPKTLAYEPWPTFDPKKASEQTIVIPISVNGKHRATVTIPASLDDIDIVELENVAKVHPAISKLLAGKTYTVLVRQNRMVNFIVK